MNTKILPVLWLGLLTVWFLTGSSFEVKAQNAPVTTIATITNAVPGNLVIPVTVTGFTNIRGFTLTMEYEFSQIQFVSAVKNPALTGTFEIGDNDLDNGIHQLVINFLSSSGISLTDGSSIVGLTFSYISGTAILQWNDGVDSQDCIFIDNNLTVLTDTPPENFYINGLVSGAEAGKTLNLNLYLEGLFNTSTTQMNKAQDYTSGVVDKYPGTVADHITIELHDATTYSTIIYQIPDVELNQVGTATVSIPDQYTGNYYITVRHRNHIETVSATAISFAGTLISYDYTTAADKAFGSNQKLLVTGKYGFYSGDVNQDGLVNATDRSLVNSKVIAISQGYIPEDINGDGSVNATDRSITNSGVINIIQRAIP